MTFILITILLFIPYSLLILYYRKSWLSISDFRPEEIKRVNEPPFVSVIIAARNEEMTIGHCLQSLKNQSYAQDKFEIIVINDHSTDNTVSVVHSFQRGNIRVFNLADFTGTTAINSYKKKSIETALQFAKGELIVTTDADCIAPERWLETLVSFYVEKSPVFIALPVVFANPLAKDCILKKFLKIFQSLDFMTLQGITGASVYKKFHSMCNGANLAYKKKVFYEVNGFEGMDEIASGDDMLLMHKIQKVHPDKIMFLKSLAVIVQTQPAETLRDFMNQRIRWASKTDKYTDKKIISVLLLVYVLNAWLLILALCSFFIIKAFYIFLFAIGLKILVELIFLYPVAKFFGKQKLLWWFVPAQPFHILYTLIAGWLGKFGSYWWKGRKVK
ncbi:MAG: glycosyltransferase [Ginsengibacter sp.]